MNLICNPSLGNNLKSARQRARVITEAWFAREGYCLNCPSDSLNATAAGTIARDFVCPRCNEAYELKGSATAHKDLVHDGGFYAMMGRIFLQEAPTLMLLHYSPQWSIQRLVAVNSVFLTPAVVRRRSNPHRRASGALYRMCDLNLSAIPPDGKIVLVDNGEVQPQRNARNAFRLSKQFAEMSPDERGWIGLVLAAVRKVNKLVFTTSDVYQFQDEMREAYPHNSHIEPKIRQQLQELIPLGYLERIARGKYRVLR